MRAGRFYRGGIFGWIVARRPGWLYRKDQSVLKLIREADEARDAARFVVAARLYEAAAERAPRRVALHVQAGHMFKEARNFAAAAEHYHQAERRIPSDADLQLQLGHFYKTLDRLDLAEKHYACAATLAPSWAEARGAHAAILRDRERFAEFAAASMIPAPVLLPRPIRPAPIGALDMITFRRLGGRREATAEGTLPVLAGIESIRGVCFSERRAIEASVVIDGTIVHQEPITSHATTEPAVRKATFNLWVDLSDIPPGLHRLDVILTDATGSTCRQSERILIAPASGVDGWPDTDAAIVLPRSDSTRLEECVRSQPTMVRPVTRRIMPTPHKILVLRTDQLGDLVISLPAIARLRQLFPAAQLVGMLTSANIDLARSLDLFDETILVEFPDDMVRRQRTMEPAAQRALQAQLSSYGFDVAIDLATSNVSRPLLRLAGARFTFGFDDGASPWLDGGISGDIRDPHNGGNVSPQSGRVLALVERLGTLFSSSASIIPRADSGNAALIALGIAPARRIIVLHCGARVVFSRWPHFAELATALLARESLTVVMLTEGTDVGASLPLYLRANDRLVLIDSRLPFEMLDALVSQATVFVGNDSGPKHLAALRGTAVVSIHCARINWAEWCQEQTGVVMSRRVPCAGCAIFHDDDECGKDFACITDITVAEVLQEVTLLLKASYQGETDTR